MHLTDRVVFERNPSLLLETPSQREGISPREEFLLRMQGCLGIQRASSLLKVSQTCCATAQAIFHRFFFRKGLKSSNSKVSFLRDALNLQVISCAALYLACKAEEEPRKVFDVMNVFHVLQQQELGTPISSLDAKDPVSRRHIV